MTLTNILLLIITIELGALWFAVFALGKVILEERKRENEEKR
jgi:hypothetical protein